MGDEKLYYFNYEQIYGVWGAVYAESEEEAIHEIMSGYVDDLDIEPVGDIINLKVELD